MKLWTVNEKMIKGVTRVEIGNWKVDLEDVLANRTSGC